jgi:hypothetical protein
MMLTNANAFLLLTDISAWFVGFEAKGKVVPSKGHPITVECISLPIGRTLCIVHKDLIPSVIGCLPLSGTSSSNATSDSDLYSGCRIRILTRKESYGESKPIPSGSIRQLMRYLRSIGMSGSSPSKAFIVSERENPVMRWQFKNI